MTIQGIAFPDLIKSKKRSHQAKPDFQKESFGKFFRNYALIILLIFFVGPLSVRLAWVQLVQGSYYRKLSNSNRTRTVTIHAPRGIIFDRNNTPLVFNIPGFRQTTHGKIRLITHEEAISFIAKGEKNIEIDSLRYYTNKDQVAHVLGYVGQISQKELLSPLYQNYNSGDLIGVMGIEKTYEKELKGIDGKELVEIDSKGSKVRSLGQTDAIPGQNIRLTLDAKLQAFTSKALGENKKGVIIVSTPRGEILSLVSKPSFDPNFFTMGEQYKPNGESSYLHITDILSDSENQPLLNRAISEEYPPGSTFKIINAAAGLETKTIDEHFEVEDIGVITIGNFSFANWYFAQNGKTDGLVNVVKAIRRSNDIFFYRLAEKVGVDTISSYARKFGVGDTLGIDLDGERKGIVPTDAWKRKTIGEPWYLGDTYHYGIGQGYVLVTPLQVNAWTQVIANGGTLYQPHLVDSQNSSIRGVQDKKVKGKKFLSDKTISLIREGMVEGCSPGGAAWPLFEFKVKNEKLKIDGKNFLEAPVSTASASTSAEFQDYRKVTIACKTGTAEHGGEKTLPHAWITLFAPAYDPQIVVTVLVESSGQGSNIAAPIAKKVLEEWFSR